MITITIEDECGHGFRLAYATPKQAADALQVAGQLLNMTGWNGFLETIKSAAEDGITKGEFSGDATLFRSNKNPN